MERDLLERVIHDQREVFKSKPSGVLRDVHLERTQKTPDIIVITGVRRCGKSTLLRQIAAKCEKFYYLTFDDERLLRFGVEDFETLVLLWKKIDTARIILLDEIQNIPGWERFVRRMYDEGYKVYVTGSNAKLLSGELATHLTGRYARIELYPFSFREFLRWNNFNPEEAHTTASSAKLLSYSDEFIVSGGFPEYLARQDADYLKRIYEDILYKDLIVRFKIREVKAFRELASYLMSNVTSEMSYNALQRILGIKNAVSVKTMSVFYRKAIYSQSFSDTIIP